MEAMAPPSADAAWTRLQQRLAAGPHHDVLLARIGAGLGDATDPRLLPLIPPQLRSAAVLIGLLSPGGDPGILLTVRAGHLRHHPGQIAFPGGAIESDDAGPAEAALREAQEEIGLARTEAQVIGFLPDQIVLTGFRITPVIARLADGFEPRPDTSEVESCFVLPFSTLLDPASERPVTRTMGGIEVAVRDLQFGPHRIWGATAGMLFALRALAVP